MKIELNKAEASNIKIALVQLAKSSQVDIQAMKVLLVLSDKFVFPEVGKSVKDKINEKTKT